MVKSSAKKNPIFKRTGQNQFDELAFPNGLIEIHPYTITVLDTKGREKKITLEVHKYKGFAMVKFYPSHLKKNPRKYELRGKELGYCLPMKNVLAIIYECALLMRDFLNENQDEFVGYIGQIDKKDNERNREQSQRCRVYNILTSSIFKDKNNYKISSKKKFKEINLRLIRLQKSKHQNKLTKKQMENYKSFLDAFAQNPKLHYQLMTNITRDRVVKEIQERVV